MRWESQKNYIQLLLFLSQSFCAWWLKLIKDDSLENLQRYFSARNNGYAEEREKNLWHDKRKFSSDLRRIFAHFCHFIRYFIMNIGTSLSLKW